MKLSRFLCETSSVMLSALPNFTLNKLFSQPGIYPVKFGIFCPDPVLECLVTRRGR